MTNQPNPQEPVAVTAADTITSAEILVWHKVENKIAKQAIVERDAAKNLGQAIGRDLARKNAIDFLSRYSIAHAPRQSTAGDEWADEQFSALLRCPDRDAMRDKFRQIITAAMPAPSQHSELADRLEALAAKATVGDLSTADKYIEGELVECPLCGEGEVSADNYINFDGKALGVQFYGIGSEFGAHENLWTDMMTNLPTILSALRQTSPNINVQKTQINADIVKQARADYDLLHVAGMASAHWIEMHAMKLMRHYVGVTGTPETARD